MNIYSSSVWPGSHHTAANKPFHQIEDQPAPPEVTAVTWLLPCLLIRHISSYEAIHVTFATPIIYYTKHTPQKNRRSKVDATQIQIYSKNDIILHDINIVPSLLFEVSRWNWSKNKRSYNSVYILTFTHSCSLYLFQSPPLLKKQKNSLCSTLHELYGSIINK